MKFIHPLCLWLIPALLAGAFALSLLARRVAARKLAGFGPADRLPRILRTLDHRAKAWKFWLVVAALCLLAVVAARPMLGPRSQDAEQSGAEFFIILDVSKSMLVRDVPPNRLEAVKSSLSEWIKTRHGDRIGLILMSGDAFVQAPLTNDYTALREVLAQSGPGSLSRGGTNLAGAIQIAATAFSKSEVKNKAIVIISDGDNLEGNPTEAARLARSSDKITIFTVGVGTEDGGPVPEIRRNQAEDFKRPPHGYVKDEYGVQARSRLDERTLRAVAASGGGRYFRFTPGDDVWNLLYTQSLRPLSRSMETVDLKDYDDLFQIPLLAALLLLAWEMAISSRLKNPPNPKSAVSLPDPGSAPSAMKMKSPPRAQAPAAALLLVLFALAPSLRASPEVLSIGQAEKLVKEGKSVEAAKALWAEAQKNPDDPYSLFNYGIAVYASGNFNEAINAFSEVSVCKDDNLRALALTNLGNAQYRLGQALRAARNGEGAIIAWERAVEYYDTTLQQRNDRIAANNLEIAREELEKTLVDVGGEQLEKGKAIPDKEHRIKLLGGAFDNLGKAVALNPSNSQAIMKREEARRLLADTLRDQARELRDSAAKSDTAKDRGKEKERLNIKASESYEQAVTVNPKDAELAREYAAFKKAVSNDFADNAEARLAEAAALEEKKGGREGKLHNQQAQLKAAVTNTEKALAFDENNARAKDLQAKALAALEKALVGRADILQEKGDETAAKATNPEAAVNQYEGAADGYQKALEINPANTATQEKLATVQSKLAAQLAKVGENEMKKAESAVSAAEAAKQAGEAEGQKAAEASKAETSQLEQGISQLEKAAQSLAQSEALAPGKNNAAPQQQKAEEQLSTLRGALDKALAGKEPGKPKDGKGEKGEKGEGGETAKGEGSGEGGAPEGGEAGDAKNPPKDGNQQVGSKFGGGQPILNFSEIRGGSEQEGQFVDKTKKESIRDW